MILFNHNAQPTVKTPQNKNLCNCLYFTSNILSLSRARVYTFVYQCAKVVRKNANWVT